MVRSKPSAMAGRIGWLRIVVGAVLAAAPKNLLKAQSSDNAPGALVLMTRTVGIRDIVLGIGTVGASRNGQGDLERWVRAGLVSDALDTIVAATGCRLIGRRGALIAAFLPIPVIVGDVYAIRLLRAVGDEVGKA